MVIRSIVIPIIEKIVFQDRHYLTGGRRALIRDSRLEEFLEEEMRRYFGVIGANECQHLREQLEEAKRNDPYALEGLVRRLLERYLKLSIKLKSAMKLRKKEPKATSESDRKSSKEKKIAHAQ
jgi:hypothetical protein